MALGKKEGDHLHLSVLAGGWARVLCLCVLERKEIGGELPGRMEGTDWTGVLELSSSVVLIQDTQNSRDSVVDCTLTPPFPSRL